MGDHRKTGKAKLVSRHQSRPTIGLLIGRLGDQRYQAHIWPGVADVAKERDVNLICFVGGSLRSVYDFDIQRNAAYDLVGPENVDGLVGMSGSLGQFIGPERLRCFYERYHPLPMVSIAMALDGIPSVLVDNEKGMRDAINHLIEVHGFRHIAFIRGPETNPEAEQRYHAYTEVLARHGLPVDLDLVVPGDFIFASGVEAIRLLIDQRRADFEAVVSANDETALGALQALHERGIRVPDEVCLVGFDDLDEAKLAAPPLTTIRQPLYVKGWGAAGRLVARLAGEDVPEQVILSTELVVRQSCGCFPQSVLQAATGPVTRTGEMSEAALATQWEPILAGMVEAAGASAAGLDPGWAEKLLDAFFATLKDQSRNAFLLVLDKVLRQVGVEGGDVMQWQRVLSVLRRCLLQYLKGDETLPRAEDLWQQARVLIGETAYWVQAYWRLQSEQRVLTFISRISEPLMTTFDVGGLADVVAQQLPKMGVESCYLSLYEQPVNGDREVPSRWSRLILAYNERGRVELEPNGRRFSSRQLVPSDILPHERRYAIALVPLYFRDEAQLGFIVFEPLQSSALLEMLHRQISTALKGDLLLQERRRAEEALHKREEAQRSFSERLTRVLDTINELSKIGSFDELCSRSVELVLERLGFDRVGLCFLSEDQQTVLGAYGTDETGHLRNEKHLKRPVKHTPTVKKLLKSPQPVVFFEKTALYDDELNQVGIGNHAVARLWNGEKIIGIYAVDNLIHQNPITDEDLEILGLYGTAMGHLFTLKQADEALRASEQTERHFQERLRTLLKVSNELSRTDSVDALCRQAVELGRTRLGFDRLEIWFRDPDPDSVAGSFGTDESGNLRDERTIHLGASNRQRDVFSQKHPSTLRQDDADFFDRERNVVGHGTQALAAMWDGEQTIGLIATDNLLKRQPITDHDCELLNLYASTLGYLCSRKRAEEALKEYSERLEEMVEERTKELREAQEQLVRREKLAMLGQLAATVSHEIRNPLATIRISVSAVDRSTRGRGLGVERALDRIQRNISRCDNIISELLDYARIPDLKPEPVCFDDWLNRVLDEQQLPEGITLSRDLASGIEIVLDPERFRRVIVNLIENARQAMLAEPEAGDKERILCVQSRVVADRLKVVIADTGPGIPADVMPHIFEPLYSTKGFGVGLGLPVVEEIVKQHGGEVEVASEAGQGTQVVVWLPILDKEIKNK
jgi:DNA-binding LacI/PurR family transcriptional regulator/signal transduction histidine kinase